MAKVRPASEDVFALVNDVKLKYHVPRLLEARIAVSFVESKPFIAGRFNWGKVSKFSEAAKIWQGDEYDFCITLCDCAYNDVLEGKQREALLDLLLNCCQTEFVPEMEQKGTKAVPAKDKWGRIIYTDEIKLDEDGNVKWKVVPLDLHAYQDNVSRYGCWCEDLLEMKNAIKRADDRGDFSAALPIAKASTMSVTANLVI